MFVSRWTIHILPRQPKITVAYKNKNGNKDKNENRNMRTSIA